MLAALSQGSLVHILDKTNGLKYKTGEVIGVTQPTYDNSSFTPGFNTQTYVEMKIKIDGVVNEFKNVSSTCSIVTYNNGNIVISETKQGIQSEVESIIQNSRHVVENIDTYENNIVEGEDILKQLNPQFAKDKDRDDKINTLSSEVLEMKGTLDKIVNILSNNNTNNTNN